jgi:hypothetical protein
MNDSNLISVITYMAVAGSLDNVPSRSAPTGF